MPRKKQKRIDEALTFDNVFEDPLRFHKFLADSFSKIKGHKSDYPIILEIGCGHGYYTLALAERFSEKLFIGLDKKADRLWKAGTWATEGGLKNALFIKSMADSLQNFFSQEGIVDEIWITFPDPYPRPSDSGKRLTSSRFLKMYRSIIKSSGAIHLKTDNKDLLNYSVDEAKSFGCNILEIKEDIHNLPEKDETLEILTFYERRFMAEGKPIYYMRFTA